MRLLVVARSDPVFENQSLGKERNASLNSRAFSQSSREARWFAWGIWAYAAIGIAVSPFFNADRIQTIPWNGATLLLATSLFLLVVGPKAVQAALEEAEPRDRHGSNKLADAYAVHRNAKVFGCYWGSLGLVTWSSVFALFAIWSVDHSEMLVLAGEVSALLIAIGCAAFGIQLASGRAKIRRELDELTTG